MDVQGPQKVQIQQTFSLLPILSVRLKTDQIIKLVTQSDFKHQLLNLQILHVLQEFMGH